MNIPERCQHIHCDDTRQTTNTKSSECSQLLTGSHITLRKLLDSSITGEPGGRVSGLPRRSRHEALEEASNAALLPDNLAAMKESIHTRFSSLSVIDPANSAMSVMSHQGRGNIRSADNCVLILSNGVTATRDSVKPAPNPATTVLGPEILPFSSWREALMASNATKPARQQISQFPRPPEQDTRTNSGLQRVSNNQRGTPSVPLLAEWRPREFLALRKSAIQLCPGLRD